MAKKNLRIVWSVNWGHDYSISYLFTSKLKAIKFVKSFSYGKCSKIVELDTSPLTFSYTVFNTKRKPVSVRTLIITPIKLN